MADNPQSLNVDTKLALARAERERRRRMDQYAQDELDQAPSFMERARGAGEYGLNIINEVNRGIMGYLPSPIRGKMEELGVGVETELSDTPVGKGSRYVGAAVPFMFGVPAASSAPAQIGRTGIFRSLIDDIGNFARQNPAQYFTAETAAAFGSGAAGDAAEDAGAGPGGQLAAEFAGGMGFGAIPAVGPRSFRAMRDSASSNLAPMTDEGGTIRASRQMQERAGGPERSAQAAQRLEDIPEGVTPAQWIGDERLMAQEARLLADNPELDAQVRGELQEARLAAQESLKDSFGRPRSRRDWEVSVLERVTPEGVLIEPGMTDDMLNQAYKSFKPLYDGAKGYDISTSGFSQELSRAPYDRNIIATDMERDSVQGWVKNMISAYSDNMAGNRMSSEDMLNMRSRVREERRTQTSRGREERADLLGSVEYEITKRLENDLPEGAREILRDADSQYRKYKVVENAIFNAEDANLSPSDLSRSIRTGGLSSDSRYARGVDEATQELRRLALAGRSTEEILGDPQRASLFVRDLSPVERQAVHADFANVLFNRAKSAEATESGIPLVSGEKLLRDLSENAEVMRNLGMTTDDIGRLRNIGEQLQSMSQKSPAAVDQLFEDGPNTILQLAATLVGAKSGQRMAGRGLGSSLVLAQYMSNKARGTLARLTSDTAERLLEDAVNDPRLYRALLTRPTVNARTARERAAYLESWLLASAYEKTQQGEQ